MIMIFLIFANLGYGGGYQVRSSQDNNYTGYRQGSKAPLVQARICLESTKKSFLIVEYIVEFNVIYIYNTHI